MILRNLGVACMLGTVLTGTVAFGSANRTGEVLVTGVDAAMFDCGFCDLGGQQTHYFKDNGPYPNVTCDGTDGAGCHEGSRSGNCYAVHYECSFLADLVPGVESHLNQWEPQQLRKLVAEGKIAVNMKRRALQVKDCDGQIAAHYPLSGAQLHDLVAD